MAEEYQPKIVIKSYMKNGRLEVCCGDERNCIELAPDDSPPGPRGTHETEDKQESSPRKPNVAVGPDPGTYFPPPISLPPLGPGTSTQFVVRPGSLARGAEELLSKCKELFNAPQLPAFRDAWPDNIEGMIVLDATNLPRFDVTRFGLMRELSMFTRCTILLRVFD